mmetsp:Transcript_90872/g.229041  ORF Transcript_90872/g.229041 Transcript_90872/m.229041 type:complete len:243 (-) Transcript_90872:269-997(-)
MPPSIFGDVAAANSDHTVVPRSLPTMPAHEPCPTASWCKCRKAVFLAWGLDLRASPGITAGVRCAAVLREELSPVVLVGGGCDVGVADSHAVVGCVHHVGAVAIRCLPLLQCARCVRATGCDVLTEGGQAVGRRAIKGVQALWGHMAEVVPLSHVQGVSHGCLPETAIELQLTAVGREIPAPWACEARSPQRLQQAEVLQSLRRSHAGQRARAAAALLHCRGVSSTRRQVQRSPGWSHVRRH